MLSKEEKLKYGEMLRQQMKEKQERKKMEDHAKRQNYNVPKSQSDRVLAADPGVFDPKIILQQKLQAQDYNPFGKAGGGAPNKKPYPGEHNLSGVMLSSPQDQHFPKMHPTQPQYYPEVYPQQAVDPRFNGSNPARKEMAVNPQLHPSAYQQSFQKSGNEYLGRQSYPQEFAQKQVFSPQISKPLDPRMVPQQKYYQPAQEMLHPFAPPQRVQQQFNQKQYTDLAPRTYQHMQQPTYNDMYRQQYPQTRPNMIPQPVQMPGMRIKTMENEQMQEMYKRGGRNLLKLQNQTTNEHLVKQKQKQEMKNFLKQQMEEAEHKKQEEKEKIKREELQEERRNREYIEMQNQKLRDQQRKKNQDKQKIVEQNLRNLAKRRQLEQEAKDKLERERLQQERRTNNQNQRVRERQRPKQQYITIRQERASREDTPSSLSSSTSEAAGTKNNFNTQISREFVRKQKLKERGRNQHDKKLDLFTNQIQKMRDQISNQGDMFKKQMDKIKREAENAQDQKKKAELQIQRLKLELDKKNKETELRLLEALKRNDPYSQIPQKVQPAMPYHPPLPQKQYQQYQQGFDSLNQLRHQNELDDRVPYGIPTKAPSYSAKPMAKTNKIYQQNPIYEQKPSDSRQKFKWQEDFKIQQSNIGTLEADSMKIPLNLPQKNTKLTMSNIQNYGKQTFMFGKPPPLPQQHQQRQISRQSKRNEKQSAMDQLDRLVEHKWQMSTVKDDITHEIEQLLKKKEGRSAPSQMQSAAMRGLSRVAIPYQGPGLNTLNSNKVSLVSNGDTVDVDKIHDRNQARLRQLRALGVQSINTTNDDDMNRLNALLNSYR